MADTDIVNVVIAFDRDASLIGTTQQVTKVEAAQLIRDGHARFVDDSTALLDLTKAQLIDKANELGVEVSSSFTKADLADAITEAETA